jgi:hypothetical protein
LACLRAGRSIGQTAEASLVRGCVDRRWTAPALQECGNDSYGPVANSPLNRPRQR